MLCTYLKEKVFDYSSLSPVMPFLSSHLSFLLPLYSPTSSSFLPLPLFLFLPLFVPLCLLLVLPALSLPLCPPPPPSLSALQKGSGYHMDLLIVGIMIFVHSALGIPWVVGATVRSITHVQSLFILSPCTAPGERPKFIGVRYVYTDSCMEVSYKHMRDTVQ